MPTDHFSGQSVRFAVFEADFQAGELRKKGVKVKLPEQPFQVLQILLENPGKVVTREELQRRLWPSDTFVEFEQGLYNAIKRLREALGDSAEKTRFIETLPKRGYRFVAELESAEAGASAEELKLSEAARQRSRWLRPAAAIVLFAALAATLFGLNIFGVRARVLGSSRVPRIRSLAVLPLTNLSGDPTQEYFSDGMTDALITDLAQISSLNVISRTSTMRYKKTDKPLPEIARELNVDGIVEGTVQRSGDRVRITAQLIQGPSDKHLWANSYERNLQDVLLLQGEVARAIADEINVRLTPQEQTRMIPTRPINLRALEAYLQGRYHFQEAKDLSFHRGMKRIRGGENEKAVRYFEQAVAEDPDYAAAYLALGESWGFPGYALPRMEQNAREAIGKALAIDPTLGEAHADLGRIEFYRWNWQAAEREYKRAIELSPNLAKAHAYYADYLDALGRQDECMKEAERSQALDPANGRIAWVFYSRRQFDRFIELKRNDVERHAFGAQAHLDLGYGYERAGLRKEAVEEWEQAMSDYGYIDLAQGLRRGYATAGFRGAMRTWVAGMEALSKKDEPVYPETVAYIYAILGEKDRAFAWLQRGYEERAYAMPYLKTDPNWDDIRSDPRFADLVRRVGLPQ